MNIKTNTLLSQLSILVVLAAFIASSVFSYKQLARSIEILDTIRITDIKLNETIDFHRNMLLAPSFENIAIGSKLIADTQTQLAKFPQYFSQQELELFDFKLLVTSIDNYTKNFHRLNNYQQLIGFSEDEGIRGKFRRATHQFQTLSQNLQDNNIEVLVLELRRREKDFLLRRDTSYLTVHEALITQIRTNITEHVNDNKKQQNAFQLIDSYQNNFQALVDGLTKIGLTPDQGLLAEFRVQENQTKDAVNLVSETISKHIIESNKSVMILSSLFILFTLIMSALLNQRILNHIYRALMNLSNQIHLIVKTQDYSTQIKYKGLGEFDTLTKDLNELIQHFQQTLENLSNTKDKLIETEKMAFVGQMVTGVAHEINTPLGIIVTSESFLRENIKQIESQLEQGTLQKSSLERMVKTANESLKLIESNLLRTSNLIASFKQVSAQNNYHEVTELNMKDLMSAINISLSREINKSNANITFNVKQNLVIQSYYGAFTQMLSIMIVNAIRHANPATPPLEIICDISVTPIALIIRVTDNGQGIPEDILPKIFEPFFTTRRNKGGTGLGLSVLYSIVNQTFNGQIKAENLEQGCQFICTMPLNEQTLKVI